MSNTYHEGPLDDYFRDEGEPSEQPSLVSLTTRENDQRPLEAEMMSTEPDLTERQPDVDHDSDHSGDDTLVNTHSPSSSMEKSHGWTGVFPNVSGPSTSPSPLSLLNDKVPGKFPTPTRPTFDTETFAERFKYLICSSGLLEKDYVPAHSGGLDDVVEVAERTQEDRWQEVRDWVKVARERWDLTLAGICLVLGLVVALGIWTILAVVVALSVAGTWYFGLMPTAKEDAKIKSAPAQGDTPESRALSSLTAFLSQSHALNTTLSSSLALLEPHPYNLHTYHTLRVSIHRLTGNMTDHLATATSTLLEFTDRRELGILGEMYDIPVVGSFFYSRRHRNASSSSEEEREMGNMTNGIPSPRRPGLPHRPSSPSSRRPRVIPQSAIDRDGSASPLRRLHTHSHRTQHLSLMSTRDAQDRFTPIPDRTPRSSKRASLERLGDTWSNRVERPRHERRITEADEEEEAVESDRSRSRSSRSGSDGEATPLYPVKEGAVSSPTSPILDTARTVPRTPILTRDTPRGSPSPFRHVPSPLSRREGGRSPGQRLQPLRTAALVTPSRPGRTSLLASPFDRESPSAPPSSAPLRAALSLDPVSNPKRRSLQSLPYYHSSDDDLAPGATGLTRTRSMPLSDLQALRTASSTGSRSRRSSYNPGPSPSLPTQSAISYGTGIGMGYPQTYPADNRSSISPIHSARPSLSLARVDSVSPLTTSALKASCLGIHLKRRRMTCCLLGLRFGDAQPQTYWEDVKAVLDELVEGMVEERFALDRVLKETDKEAAATAILESMKAGTRTGPGSSIDSWSPAESVFPAFNRKDFAPRTSDEALLLSSIDGMGSALVKAYMDLTGVREGLAKSTEVGLGMEGWSEVRTRLGECVREWEKGREVLSRMSGATQPEVRGVERERRDVVMPDFMKGWRDVDRDGDEEGGGEGDTSQGTSLQTDRDDEEQPPVDDDRDLPPVGKDMVFEGTSVVSDNRASLRNMSREERIELTRQAREKGFTLVQLLRMQAGDGDGQMERARAQKEEEMRMKGGLVVDELRGVIGVIRRIKDGEVPPSEFLPDAENELREPADSILHRGDSISKLGTKGEEHDGMKVTSDNGAINDDDSGEVNDDDSGEVNDDDVNDMGIESEIERSGRGERDANEARAGREGKEVDDTDRFRGQLDLGELMRSFKFPNQGQEQEYVME